MNYKEKLAGSFTTSILSRIVERCLVGKVLSVCSLEFATYTYLAFPVLIFFLFWLKPIIALSAASLMLLGMYRIWKEHPPTTSTLSWTSFPLEIVIAPAFMWTILSGVGGYAYQNFDWIKHNSILFHLSTSTWPVILPSLGTRSEPIYLLYYFAYYLPAALVGRVAGLEGAALALFLWTLVGVVLSLLWFVRLVGAWRWTTVVLFIFFGGMSFFAYALSDKQLPAGNLDLDWWGGLWQYYDNTASLFWVPQHSLGGWLSTALILHAGWHRRSTRSVLAIWSLTPFWSPFVSLGVAPFVCLALWQNKRSDLFSLQNGSSLFFLGIGAAFFSANRAVSGGATHSGWIWTFLNMYEEWPRLALFYLVNFAVYAALVWHTLRQTCNKADWHLWMMTLFCLVLIPLYAVGNIVLPDISSNDFCMRVSIPPLFVLVVFLGRALNSKTSSASARLYNSLLTGCLAIGAFGAIAQISRTIQRTSGFCPTYVSIVEQPPGYRYQYYGNQHSVLLKAIFKTSH